MVEPTKNREHHFDPWGKASVDQNERLLIEGPRRRISDIRRLGHIMLEFMRGFHTFRNLGPCVTFFGSARFHEDDNFYKSARLTAASIGKSGYTIMTGGGPGIMEAANRGAKDVDASSVGCNITLPGEQKPNPYLDRFVEFDHFYVRKVMLLRYSCAFVAFPGGFGTMDEIFETITLIQTKKISDFPIVLMGLDFWLPLKSFIFDTLLANHTIGKEDLKLITFTDDPSLALECITTYAGCKPRL